MLYRVKINVGIGACNTVGLDLGLVKARIATFYACASIQISCLLTKQTFKFTLSKHLHNANYFNHTFVKLQGTSYCNNKKTSHSVLVKNGKTFQTFSRIYKQNSRTSQDSKKKTKTFQDVATLQINAFFY